MIREGPRVLIRVYRAMAIGLYKICNSDSFFKNSLMREINKPEIFTFLRLIDLYKDILILSLIDRLESKDKIISTDFLNLVQLECMYV